MKFPVKNEWTREVKFVAEIEADGTTPIGVKLGLAVKWAIKNRAVLSGAVLSGADLSRAVLSDADLSGADLSGAVLSDADLSGADLSDAVLSRAVLSDAVLSGADLSGAVLSDADLSGAVLSRASVFKWVQKNTIKRRVIGERILVLAQRSKRSQHVGDTVYKSSTLHIAPFFSRCPVTECHPGLYIAGNAWDCGHEIALVACWQDEIHITSTDSDKARVPRFYVVEDEAHFDKLTGDELEEKESA